MTNVCPEKRAKIAKIADKPLDLSNKQSPPRPLSPIFSIKKITETRQELINQDTDITPTILSVSRNLSDIPSQLLDIEIRLTKNLEKILFNKPIEYVYSPILYAKSVHWNYLDKYCRNKKKILFLGMNPGPWGMSQTGVPFGEVNIVLNWLKISGKIHEPIRQQSKRKILGFSCKRSEISGNKFWSLFKNICHNKPEIFFQDCFLRNYCPIALMDNEGRNITPAEIKGSEQKILRDFCDQALIQVIKLLNIETVIGIGRFSEQRAKHVIKTAKLSTNVLWMSHPSPRAAGKKNWNDLTLEFLKSSNLLNFFIDKNLSKNPGVS